MAPQLASKLHKQKILSDTDVVGRNKAECLSEQVLKPHSLGLNPALEPLICVTIPAKHSNFLSTEDGQLAIKKYFND